MNSSSNIVLFSVEDIHSESKQYDMNEKIKKTAEKSVPVTHGVE